MKKTWILLLSFVLVLALAGALYAYLGAQQAPQQLAAADGVNNAAENTEKGTDRVQNDTDGEKAELSPAPDFTVYDMDGNAVQLSDFLGTPVVINFWASWCPPCKSEMPDFDAACADLDGAVQFMMINVTDGSRETVDTASAYVEAQDFTFPVFYDTELDAAYVYGASSLPATYFIDAEGYAVARAVGAIDAATLQTGIDMILPQ